MKTKRLTLVQLAVLGIGTILVLLAFLLYLLNDSSRKAIEQSSTLLVEIEEAGDRVEQRVRAFFEESDAVLEALTESENWEVLKNPDESLGPVLKKAIADRSDFSELTFTWPEGQYSLQVGAEKTLELIARKGSEASQHPTYRTLVRRDLRGRKIWSDLHYSQVDQELPDRRKRVILSLQQAVVRQGELLGVARVGRSTSHLQGIAELSDVPGWMFLSDDQGRLITRFSDETILAEDGDSLRYPTNSAPQPVQEALALLKADNDSRLVKRLTVDGENYIVAFRELPDSQDWVVGMVWSQKHFLEPLLQVRQQMVVTTLLILIATILMVIGLLRRIHRDLSGLTKASSRMQDLDFSADEELYSIQDTAEVGASLEGAKATLRAASKYVPLDLIKQLFSRDIKPELGGESRELTILFTDVAGFTTISEAISTDELARQMAVYLEQMDGAVEKHSGEVLERIGDALLVVWNAPSLVDNHSFKACLAALACVEATHDNEWKTRYGIHRDEVMLGHFGSEKRMNYGILGDGVNLASRVEGMNKHYGTTILVTGSVKTACSEGLSFRLIDRVVVKGKSEAVELYELQGLESEISEADLAKKGQYESAFEFYLKGEFQKARAGFEKLPDDQASSVLAQRCEELEKSPPEAWDGAFRATFK